MGRRVIFAPTSVRDLADSVSYVARFDATAAVRLGESLIDAAERMLSSHPYAGPICPELPEGPTATGCIGVTGSFIKSRMMKSRSRSSVSGTAPKAICPWRAELARVFQMHRAESPNQTAPSLSPWRLGVFARVFPQQPHLNPPAPLCGRKAD